MSPKRRESFFNYVLADGLLVGSESPFWYPNAAEFIADFSQTLGVTRLVSLPQQNVRHVSVLTHDLCPLPNSKLRLEDVLPVARHLADCVQREERVWAHCQKGVDRTGTVLGGAAVLLGEDPAAVADGLMEIFSVKYGSNVRSLLAHQMSLIAALADAGT